MVGDTTESCKMCGATEFKVVASQDVYKLNECVNCGFGFINPLPTEEQLAAMYSDPTYFSGGGEHGYRNGYESTIPYLIEPYRLRLERIESLIGKGIIVDVGSATGMFVTMAKERGWEPIAVEYSDEARESMAKEGIFSVKSIEDLEAKNGQVSLVTYWEVLEHLTDFRSALSCGVNLLADGGMVAVSVPNYGNMRVQANPSIWGHFKPPEHIWYWDPNTLSSLLAEFGLEVVHVEGQSFIDTEAIYTPVARSRGFLYQLAKTVLPPTLITAVRDKVYRPLLYKSFAEVKERHGDTVFHCTLIMYARKRADKGRQ